MFSSYNANFCFYRPQIFLLTCVPVFPLLILLHGGAPFFSALSLVDSTISCNRIKPLFLASLTVDRNFLFLKMRDKEFHYPSFHFSSSFRPPNLYHIYLKKNLFTLELFYVYGRVAQIIQRVLVYPAPSLPYHYHLYICHDHEPISICYY